MARQQGGGGLARRRRHVAPGDGRGEAVAGAVPGVRGSGGQDEDEGGETVFHVRIMPAVAC